MSQQSQQEFARRLRTLRRTRGLTQRDLAGDWMSVSYVSLLETGRRTPTSETVRVLAGALDCTVAELLGEQDAPATRPAVLNIRFGQVALEAGDADQAQQHFRDALTAPDLDPLLRTEAVIGAARALESQGRLAEAAAAYESLVTEAVDAPRLLASLHVVVGWCRCLYEMGELERAVEIGVGVMEEVDRLEAWHSENAIQLLSTVAAANVELGNIDQAERLLREGLDRTAQMRSPRARAAVLCNASHLASERGRHREALELAEEALVHLRQDADRRAAARLLAGYGYLLLRQDPPRPAEATSTLHEALEMLYRCGRGFDRGYVLTALSRAHLMQGDAQAAAETAELSLVELGPEAALERARAETALAAALVASGQREKATGIFARAVAALGELTVSRQAARAWVELGDTLMEAGAAAAAADAFRQATTAMNLGSAPTAPPTAQIRGIPVQAG